MVSDSSGLSLRLPNQSLINEILEGSVSDAHCINSDVIEKIASYMSTTGKLRWSSWWHFFADHLLSYNRFLKTLSNGKLNAHI